MSLGGEKPRMANPSQLNLNVKQAELTKKGFPHQIVQKTTQKLGSVYYGLKISATQFQSVGYGAHRKIFSRRLAYSGLKNSADDVDTGEIKDGIT